MPRCASVRDWFSVRFADTRRSGELRYFRPRLTVTSTQAQLAGPLAAMFLHLPRLRLDVVQSAPLWQTALPGLVAHGPSATKPARCSKPGNPVSCEQVPP